MASGDSAAVGGTQPWGTHSCAPVSTLPFSNTHALSDPSPAFLCLVSYSALDYRAAALGRHHALGASPGQWLCSPRYLLTLPFVSLIVLI